MGFANHRMDNKQEEEVCRVISAIELSNYVIQKANEAGCSITHLKLQKILYYIQGTYLAETGDPLFEEPIEAWTYGPVIRDVYVHFVSNGALSLHVDPHVEIPKLGISDRMIVDRVLEDKLKYTASELVGATHHEMPWKEHAQEVKKGDKPIILNDSIRKYFLRNNA